MPRSDVRPEYEVEPGVDPLAASLCRLAAADFQVPGAFLLARDSAGLVVRGAFGLARDLPSVTRLAHRRLVRGQPLVVADARSDRNFCLEAAVLQPPGLRFYADMPVAGEGGILGVLGLVSDAPAPDFGPDAVERLGRLADHAAVLMVATITRRDAAPVSTLDNAADLARYAYWKLDLDSGNVRWSPGLYELYGIDPQAFAPQVSSHFDLYDPRDRAGVFAILQAAVRRCGDFDYTARLRSDLDPAQRSLRTRGCVESAADGTPVRLCAVVCDVRNLPQPSQAYPVAEALPSASPARKAAKAKPPKPESTRAPARTKTRSDHADNRAYLRHMVEDMKLHWEDLAPGHLKR